MKFIQALSKKGIKNLWLQLGIINDEVALQASKDGLNFIQDACFMVEHKKFMNES